MRSALRSTWCRLLAAWFSCAALLVDPTTVRAIVDRDGDKYSDLWELAYGHGFIPEGDDDHDGRTNKQEHDEGTDPTNAESVVPDPLIESLKKGKIISATWPSMIGKWYQLQVSFDEGPWSNLGPAQYGTGETMQRTFAPATQYLTGGPFISRWLSFNGSIDTLKNYAANGTPAPTETGTIPNAETKQTNPDQSNFGQWVRGWIIPPATGKYTFSIASDDQSALFVSTSADPNLKQPMASLDQWTNFQQWDKYPTQKSKVVVLKAGKPYYFEAFQREGTGGDHLSVGWTGPRIGTVPTVIDGAYIATDPQTVAQKLKTGAVPTYRVNVFDRDTDGDGLTDFEEVTVGLDPTNPKTVSRTADKTTVLAMLDAANTVTVGTEVSRGYEKEQRPLKFTFFRSGGANPITVKFEVAGTAQAGLDFAPLSGTVDFAVGQTAASVEIVPADDSQFEPAESITVNVTADAAYTVGTPSSATATVDDAADAIYVATLRPVDKKTGGYGTAALRMTGNHAFADISLSFGNLSAAEAGADFYVAGTGGSITPVLTFANGQLSTQRWDLTAAAGGLTPAQIVAAIEGGKLYARVNTDAFPAGEIVGQFVKTWGWKDMPKPTSPGAAPAKARNDAEAARFLTQATYGPTVADIAAVKKLGFSGWISQQFSKPVTNHLTYVKARRAELMARDNNDGWQTPRQEAWWQAALASPDQLRQRVAFALSEILVVSDVGVLEGAHEGLTNYYDLLSKNAFGNFRTLLEEVTLSPMMGQYLSMARNQKPNPDSGAEPDENYAREIMQLFTIGLNQLNPDGSLQLNENGLPIPTYSQYDIVGLAHVFTGWGSAYDPKAPPDNLNNFFRYDEIDPINRMVQYPNFHDTKAKRIVGGLEIPAGLTGEQEMKIALDTLFKHQNVGPFIARQLIQRLVTSNPSRGYVYRVASKFNNNGHGVRGDLKAVVRAVLLDPEARNPLLYQNASYGKLREPLLRISHVLRAFNATLPVPPDKRYFVDLQYSLTTQGALKSPSVFNFFQPGYIQPGVIAKSGLFSPEFQITSETTVISQTNVQYSIIYNGIWTPEKNAANQNGYVALDIEPQITLLSREGLTKEQNQDALIDHLNVMLTSGQMSNGLRQSLKNGFAAFPNLNDVSHDRQRDRVRAAIFAITASPEYSVQK